MPAIIKDNEYEIKSNEEMEETKINKELPPPHSQSQGLFTSSLP